MDAPAGSGLSAILQFQAAEVGSSGRNRYIDQGDFNETGLEDDSSMFETIPDESLNKRVGERRSSRSSARYSDISDGSFKRIPQAKGSGGYSRGTDRLSEDSEPIQHWTKNRFLSVSELERDECKHVKEAATTARCTGSSTLESIEMPADLPEPPQINRPDEARIISRPACNSKFSIGATRKLRQTQQVDAPLPTSPEDSSSDGSFQMCRPQPPTGPNSNRPGRKMT